MTTQAYFFINFTQAYPLILKPTFSSFQCSSQTQFSIQNPTLSSKSIIFWPIIIIIITWQDFQGGSPKCSNLQLCHFCNIYIQHILLSIPHYHLFFQFFHLNPNPCQFYLVFFFQMESHRNCRNILHIYWRRRRNRFHI